MSGSGGAPQLDERALLVELEDLLDYSMGAGGVPGASKKTEFLLGQIRARLAASSGGGELDLTDEEAGVLLLILDRVKVVVAATGKPVDFEALQSAHSKLRARLDRKDDDQ